MALSLAFLAMTCFDAVRTARDLKKAESDIRAGIVTKGKRLAYNGGIAMSLLAEENSISAIREILGNTVDGDSDIVYGIFTDPKGKPWAFKDRRDRGDGIGTPEPSLDTTSAWAIGIHAVEYRSRAGAGAEIVEFAAPVRKEYETLGIIRFGLTTKSMHRALDEAEASSRAARRQALLLFILAAAFALVIAMSAATFQAARFTRPIISLTLSASRIAAGDYEAEVKAEGNDEIAILAASLESMRLKIKGYMRNLQALVDVKVRQIRDILDNIEQGLFTIDLDLRIHDDSSRKAAAILGVPDLAGRFLGDILRLDAKDVSLFRDWVEIAEREHGKQRWAKLMRLAPVQEIRIGAGKAQRIIKLEYQKILDQQGRLAKIMVLARDVTGTRAVEKRMQEAKVLHEKTVKTILGIARHHPDTIREFLRDATSRIRSISDGLREMGSATEGKADALSARMFRDCHTLKGNSGAFGFETLAAVAESFETLLQLCDSGSVTIKTRMEEARHLCDLLLLETENIHEDFLLFAGNDDGATVRLAEAKVTALREMAETVSGQPMSPETARLVERCKRLTDRSLDSLTRKYRDLVAHAARACGKDIEMLVSPRDLELDPRILHRLDETLTHLLRNAVAHGIETPEERVANGKAPGRIELFYACLSGNHMLTVRDNGRGIDADAVAEKAVKAGIIPLASLAGMSHNDKIALVFSSGLSTAPIPDSLAGRGLGLSIAAECIHNLGGTLAVESEWKEGTTFTITLPA